MTSHERVDLLWRKQEEPSDSKSLDVVGLKTLQVPSGSQRHIGLSLDYTG